VFPLGYELDSYIPSHGILHNHRRENLNFRKFREDVWEIGSIIPSFLTLELHGGWL
jgi:hypothetical protein